jgi:hypothetical protein
MSKRMVEKNWIVVLKSLLVTRRVMLDGGRHVARAVADKHQLLNLQSWSDDSSPKGWAHSIRIPLKLCLFCFVCFVVPFDCFFFFIFQKLFPFGILTKRKY